MPKKQPTKTFHETFHRHFELLKEIKELVVDELKDWDKFGDVSATVPSFHDTPSGKRRRRYYPHGVEVFEPYMTTTQSEAANNEPLKPNIPFVGFFGNLKKIDPALEKRLWDVDAILMEELKKSRNILGYFSMEQEKGGVDWYNMVLFKNETFLQEWKDTAAHTEAVKDITPQCYTTINIHSGQILGGIEGDFEVSRTLSLEYNSTGTLRQVHPWE